MIKNDYEHYIALHKLNTKKKLNISSKVSSLNIFLIRTIHRNTKCDFEIFAVSINMAIFFFLFLFEHTSHNSIVIRKNVAILSRSMI